MAKVDVVMYSTAYCPYCISARQLLESKKIPYKDIRVDQKPELRDKMRVLSGRTSVPQIWLAGKHIGGFTELKALAEKGGLDDFGNA
jgi:glutaredoxin 3